MALKLEWCYESFSARASSSCWCHWDGLSKNLAFFVSCFFYFCCTKKKLKRCYDNYVAVFWTCDAVVAAGSPTSTKPIGPVTDHQHNYYRRRQILWLPLVSQHPSDLPIWRASNHHSRQSASCSSNIARKSTLFLSAWC